MLTRLRFPLIPLPGHGLLGLLDSVEAGQSCGSDTSHLSLLGYDPLVFYRGRGAFESMGAGLEMDVGDVAFKSNFATLASSASTTAAASSSSATVHPASQPIVHRRRADRAFHAWGQPLCDALDGARLPNFPDVRVSVRYATEHRCGVRLRGPGLTDCVSGTDPLKDGLPLAHCRPTDASPEARRTAQVVNEVSRVFQHILSRQPLNIARAEKGMAVADVVLLRGAGARIQVPEFVSPSYSKEQTAKSSSNVASRACMVAPTAIIRGLGKSLGFDILPCAAGTGDYRTNLQEKARVILDEMMRPETPHSFGFLHIKAVDDAGHDRDIARKVDWLERSDQMIGGLIRRLTQEKAQGGIRDTIWTIVVTGDHSTPVVYGDHACEPVPFVAATLQHLDGCEPTAFVYPTEMQQALQSEKALTYRSLVTAASSPPRFDELSCAGGSLGRFPGREVMLLLRRIHEAVI